MRFSYPIEEYMSHACLTAALATLLDKVACAYSDIAPSLPRNRAIDDDR